MAPLGTDVSGPIRYDGSSVSVIGEVTRSSAGNAIVRIGQMNQDAKGWHQTEHLVLSPNELETFIADLKAQRVDGDRGTGRRGGIALAQGSWAKGVCWAADSATEEVVDFARRVTLDADIRDSEIRAVEVITAAQLLSGNRCMDLEQAVAYLAALEADMATGILRNEHGQAVVHV